MTKTGAAARPTLDDRTDSVVEWAELHAKQIAIGVVAVVILAVGVWVYGKSKQAQEQNASTSLVDAEQAYAAGNLPLAQSDLERIVGRYADTKAGAQARILLAEVYYDNGQFIQGTDQLRKLISSKAPLVMAAAHNLLGAGLEQQNKFAEAADEYQKAADAASYKTTRDQYLANAARALALGGKTSDAIAIWTKLADDPTSPSAAEAHVRLGELEAKAAKS